MDKEGFRPATLVELFAMGEAHPELQKKFPIVSLGSVWRNGHDSRLVPVLGFVGNGRDLDLLWFGYDWDDYCRFLGVRKSFYYPVFIFKGGFLQ